MCGHSEKYATIPLTFFASTILDLLFGGHSTQEQKAESWQQHRCLTENKTWPKTSLAHLRAGNRNKSGKPRYNAEGVTWPKLSSWHHVFNGGSPEIRGSEISGSEVEQIQKFGENYANQLKKILGTKTCNSQCEIKLQHAATFKGSLSNAIGMCEKISAAVVALCCIVL